MSPSPTLLPGLLRARATKRRTRAGRLRGIDALLPEFPMPIHWSPGDVWVELGFGCELDTVVELRRALDNAGVRHGVVALDCQVDDELGRRVPDGIRVGHSGFELQLKPGETPRVIRLCNVLRAYTEREALAAQELLCQQLVEGGWLIEGSSCLEGTVLTAHYMQKDGRTVRRRSLLFHTDFKRGFAPNLFRDRLPRDLRRDSHGDGVLANLFERWNQSFRRAQERTREARRCFAVCAQELAGGQAKDWDLRFVGQGTLIWTPQAGVPLPRGG